MDKKLNFYLELDEGADRVAVANLLSERLLQLEEVHEVAALPTETRLTGVEISAGILLTVTIVKGARELVEELNKLMPEIKKLVVGMKEIKSAAVEVGFDKVKVQEAGQEVIQELAQEMEE